MSSDWKSNRNDVRSVVRAANRITGRLESQIEMLSKTMENIRDDYMLDIHAARIAAARALADLEKGGPFAPRKEAGRRR